MEGQPVLGVFGVIEWFLIWIGVFAFYLLQHLNMGGLTTMAKSFWLLAAGGYTALVLAHGILTTRDG